MKKLIVAAVAMAMAVAANAATTAWGIPYAEIEGAEGPVQFTGGTAFLYSYTGTAPSFDTEAGVWNLAGASLLATADYDEMTMGWGKFDTTSASKLDSTSLTGADQAYAIILTSETASDVATFVGSDKYAAIVTGVTTYETGFEEVGGATFNYVNAVYPDQVYASDWVNVAAPVPEPTSGLLLLLGVAGLALRRRRA